MAKDTDFNKDEWPMVLHPHGKEFKHAPNPSKNLYPRSKPPGDEVHVDIEKERELADKTRKVAREKLEAERKKGWFRRNKGKEEKLAYVANKASERAYGPRGEYVSPRHRLPENYSVGILDLLFENGQLESPEDLDQLIQIFDDRIDAELSD